jgi:MerR family transcriptional regulator, copper efflux regulator
MSTHGGEGIVVGEVARMFGLAVSTLHYWEQRGLIRPRRDHVGRRRYGGDELYRIALIRTCQDTGLMSLEEVATMLAGGADIDTWRELVSGRITAIDARIEQLTRARDHLSHMLRCPRDNPATDCPELRAQIRVPTITDVPDGAVSGRASSARPSPGQVLVTSAGQGFDHASGWVRARRCAFVMTLDTSPCRGRWCVHRATDHGITAVRRRSVSDRANDRIAGGFRPVTDLLAGGPRAVGRQPGPVHRRRACAAATERC